MKLVVGLGNPGDDYVNTRHNIGFMCIDHYAKNKKIFNFKEKFNGLYTRIKDEGEDIIFVKPLSYMNLSGTVVKKYVEYFKIDIDNILVIQDDLDMPVGKYKLKRNGSSGGHNGIKNIIENLQTENFKRLKLGISKNSNIDTKDYVLGNINNNELQIFSEIFNITDNIIEDFIISDYDKLMNKYNGAFHEISK